MSMVPRHGVGRHFGEGKTDMHIPSRMHLGRLGLAVLTLAGTATVASVASGGGASAGASSASGAPIMIAMITSLTGEGSSEFSQAPAGFNARVALQNAEGGVNGHKIDTMILDDQTSPSAVVSAVQGALAKGAFGIVSDSPLFFLADKYPQEQGEPVTGGFFDGPEWGTQPFTNMFASDVGSLDPKYPVNTAIGTFLKSHGALLLRLRHLSLVDALGGRHGRLVQARGRQGGRPRHLDPVRLRGDDHAGAGRQAERL
jgi:hypothetical protein